MAFAIPSQMQTLYPASWKTLLMHFAQSDGNGKYQSKIARSPTRQSDIWRYRKSFLVSGVYKSYRFGRHGSR